MNEIIKAIEERRSIRKFQPTMPAKEDLAQIVEAGLYAASGMGRQSAIIVAVTNKELRDQLAKTNAEIMGKPDFDPFYGAPAILIVLADKSCRTAIYDGSLVMGNMMLAAHSLGLGSIWIHRAKEEFERPEYQALLKSWVSRANGKASGTAQSATLTAKPRKRRNARITACSGLSNRTQ